MLLCLLRSGIIQERIWKIIMAFSLHGIHLWLGVQLVELPPVDLDSSATWCSTAHSFLLPIHTCL